MLLNTLSPPRGEFLSSIPKKPTRARATMMRGDLSLVPPLVRTAACSSSDNNNSLPFRSPLLRRLSEAAGLTLGLEKAENVVLTDYQSTNVSNPTLNSGMVSFSDREGVICAYRDP